MKPPKFEALPIWFKQGNCTDLGIDAEIMVPEAGDLDAELQAKTVCVACVVGDMCLTWAMKSRRDDLGVYAGRTAHERELLTKKIARAKHGKPRTN